MPAREFLGSLWLVLTSIYLSFHSFEKYPEDEVASYGIPGDDPHADEFPDFEYTGQTGVV